MPTIEESLRELDTDDLQRRIRENALIPEATSIATVILRERGAMVPEPMTESEMEDVARSKVRASYIKLWLFIGGCVGLAAYMWQNPSASEKSIYWVMLSSFLPWLVSIGVIFSNNKLHGK